MPRAGLLESVIQTNLDQPGKTVPWKEFAEVTALLCARRPVPVFVDGRRAYDKRSFANDEGIGL